MLVGFCGQARSGKDTSADYLKETFGAVKLSFAHPIKEVLCKEILGMTDEQVYGNLKEVIDPKFNKSPREIMQFLGTEVFRTLNPNVWTEYFVRNVKRLEKENPRTILAVTDCRFKNEINLVKELGGIVIKLVRPNGPGASKGIEGHASEVELLSVPDDEFHAVLNIPEGGFEYLRDSVINIVESEFNGYLFGR